MILFVRIVLFLLVSGSAAWPFQELTREEEHRRLREKKLTALAPDRQSRVEQALLWIQERKLQEKLETPGAGYHGIRPRLGGLSTGSGFGYGFRYDRVRMIRGHVDFSLTAAASAKKYQLYNVRFDIPRLADGRLFAALDLRYRNMPQEDYFGLGPKSSRSSRTSYLHEDATYGLEWGVRPLRWLRVGSHVGWAAVNVGRGTDERFPSTEELFNEADTPGLIRQSDFLRSGIFAEIDTRDSPGNPSRGSLIRAAYDRYDDRDLDRFNFDRFEGELQQYFPFLQGYRVVAFRFFTSLDQADAGSRVPFYFQRPLGGSNDLRGFREFRFRDLNQIVLNLEYRWEAFSGMDMALFGDAGKVFGNRDDFNLKKLEGDFGIGMRFNTAKSVFLRIDLAHGREGSRLFIKFNHVF